MKKNLYFLIVLITVSSCKKEVPLTFSEYNFTSEELAIIDVNIPKVEGSSEIANKINGSIEEFVINKISSEENKYISIEEASDRFNKHFIEFEKEFPDISSPWEALIDGEVTYESSDLICIAINSYQNIGAAHGSSFISFLNFNPKTGEFYKLDDIINNLKEFKLLVEVKLKKNKQEGVIMNLDNGFILPETLGFNDEGVIILYNTFLTANSLNNIFEFTIPYEEVNDLLKVH